LCPTKDLEENWNTRRTKCVTVDEECVRREVLKRKKKDIDQDEREWNWAKGLTKSKCKLMLTSAPPKTGAPG
jgi:hypothetical protein